MKELAAFRKYLLSEKLSATEKKKRRLKAIGIPSTDDEIGIPSSLKALARGTITEDEIEEYNANHDEDGLFDDDKGKGSWSIDGAQHRRSGGKKGKSERFCGRKKRSDGRQYKCKNGELREEDLVNLPDGVSRAYLVAIIKKEIEARLKQSKGKGFSIDSCLRFLNRSALASAGELNKPAKD